MNRQLVIAVITAVTGAITYCAHASLLPQIDALTQSDIVIEGARWVGKAVCNAGDVNGDGIADIAFTASGTAPSNLYNAGSAYIFFGKQNFASPLDPMAQADVTINGSYRYGNMGDSISTSGDVNGDGIDDILIGASDLDSAYLFLGSSNLSGQYDAENDADVVFEGWGGFGDVLEIGGDVNGDGIDDIIIGAPGGAGAAYLFYGRLNWPGGTIPASNCDVKFVGAQAGDNLGWSVSCSGDVNGDGLADIVLGAPRANRGGEVHRGEAYIIYGRSNLAGEIDVGVNSNVILKTNEGGEGVGLGGAVCDSGDVNDDGIYDIVISAPGSSSKKYKAGEAYIILGGSNLPSVIDVRENSQVIIAGSFEDEIMGEKISSGGDVNRDGIDDCIIGSNGKAYCILGRRDWPPMLDMAVEADCVMREYALFGESVCNGGDVNGDGMADIIVGDSLGGTVSGAAYVIYGSPLPLGLTVQKNSRRSDNERVFHPGEILTLSCSIHPSYGKPRFDQGQKLQAALGVQYEPDYPDPMGGGQIYVYKPGLKKLVPLPDDLAKLHPTFENVSFPPLRNPLVGAINFVVPSGARGKFCFIGTIYNASCGEYPAGIVRSTIFKIE